VRGLAAIAVAVGLAIGASLAVLSIVSTGYPSPRGVAPTFVGATGILVPGSPLPSELLDAIANTERLRSVVILSADSDQAEVYNAGGGDEFGALAVTGPAGHRRTVVLGHADIALPTAHYVFFGSDVGWVSCPPIPSWDDARLSYLSLPVKPVLASRSGERFTVEETAGSSGSGLVSVAYTLRGGYVVAVTRIVSSPSRSTVTFTDLNSAPVVVAPVRSQPSTSTSSCTPGTSATVHR